MKSRTPPPSTPRDLVAAKMTVTAPKHDALTGGQPSTTVTGRNTAWAKPPLTGANVPRYQARKEYMQAQHADHPFAQTLMARHVQAVEAEDKRGLSCAEGHSVMEAHHELQQRGQTHAAQHLEAFKASLVQPVAPWVEPAAPQRNKNHSASQHRKALALHEGRLAPQRLQHQALVQQREGQLSEMATALTGMPSWEHYAAKESSFMAWNDIQQHGHLSEIHHHPHSDISPGQSMEACPMCRKDIVERMKKR